MRFSKKNAIFVFVVFMLHQEKQKNEENKMEKAKKTIKIVLRWSFKKKRIFSKNCLTLFVSGREKKNARFRAHYLFWPKNFLTKTVKTRKN